MIRRRPPLFWILAAASAALGAWWLFHVPYAPRRLYAAIPAGATFVTRHRDLAARWESFSKNPLTRSLLASLGIEPSALKDLTEDPESRAWFEKLASRDVVLAFVPVLGDHGEPVWVLSSWVGGRSQRMRWSLSWRRVPGFTPQKRHRGRMYWRVDSPFLRPGVTLTIAFEEGMLIGCMSRHADTMQDLLDTYDGILPSVAADKDLPRAGSWCSKGGAPDCGWVDVSGLVGPKASSPSVVSYEFSEVMPTCLVGRACGEAPFEVAASPLEGLKTGGLDRLLGDLPIAVTVFRTSLLRPFTEAKVRPLWLHLLGEHIYDQKADMMAGALLAGDYGGRFKGIKIPALVVAMPVSDADAALAWMAQALDRLNARYRWGLIPHEIPLPNGRVFAVDGTGEGAYAALALEEKAGYAVCGHWLLLASNAGCLTKLVERYDRDEAATGAGSARWNQGLNEVPAPCYGWIDLARGGKTLRLAVTTYSLKLLMEDPRGSQKSRQRLNEAKAWIDSFAPLETCRFWLRSDGRMMDLNFRVGK